MELIKLTRAVHGKAAFAVYGFKGHRMNVYVRHNKMCTTEYGEPYISCYISKNSNTKWEEDNVLEKSYSFTDYSQFKKLKNKITTNENSTTTN